MHCAGEFEHVDRIDIFSEGDDRNLRRNLPNRNYDIRILGIREIRKNQSRAIRSNQFVGFTNIATPCDNNVTVNMKCGGCRRIGFDDHIGDFQIHEPLNKAFNDRVVTAYNNVILCIGRHLARCAHPNLRLEPGGIEIPDEGERRDDEQHHDSVQKDDDTERTA